ncbi:MAG: hypothetical protein IMF12_11130, partial [Proteobacteria bacterium]|nr:hypothetical protein [Pseudomonadota bacterium]
ILVGPAKILRDVDLVAPGKLSDEPGAVLPITVTLSNGSAEADTFNVTVVDSSGWTIEDMTGINADGSVTVEALQSADIAFNVVLGAKINTTDVITIVAISQSDMTAIAETKVQLAVVTTEELINNNTSIPDVSTGVNPNISTGINDAPFINPSSLCPITGNVNGICSNKGHLITEATINGSIAGGELGGNVTITGMVSNVTIVEDAVITGGKLTGIINNGGRVDNFDFVGTLFENGTIGGNITNSSSMKGVFKNVNLAANAKIEKVKLQGKIVGDSNAPAILQDLTIEDNTYLENIVIGSEVILGDNITFGTGVQFDSILESINALVKDIGLEVTQNADQLQAQDGTVLYAVKVIESNRAKRKASLRLTPTQAVHFITATDLDITAQPAVQDIEALQIALAAIDLPNVEVQANGNIKVSSSDTIWYSARPNLFSVETDTAIGLSVNKVANFVFELDGKKREQSFYAA